MEVDAARAGDAQPWSSDLSVSEVAAMAHLGLSPAGLVMGTSVYSLGGGLGPSVWSAGAGGWWRSYPCPHGWLHEGARTGYNVEHVYLESGLREARDLAIGRLAEEALSHGAHIVAGVRVKISPVAGAGSVIELRAVGTSLRRPGRAPGSRVLTSHLSGQDLAKVLAGGMAPLGIVMGVGAVEVAPGCGTEMSASSWSNTELFQYSEAVQMCRDLAVEDLEAQTRALGADSAVGVSVDWRIHELAGGAKLCELSAWATAVRRFSDEPLPKAPLVMLPLDDRRQE